MDLVIPETPGVNWKDLTPRTGVVYDVFGSGKTALKVSLNKYVTGQALQGSANGNTLIFGSNLNPYNRLVLSTTRAWTDGNGNWVPDCNLALPGATGECGPMSNDLFGQTSAGNAYDPETMSGWGKRVYNWEFGTGVQHELLPSTGLEVTYYRRWFGNLIHHGQPCRRARGFFHVSDHGAGGFASAERRRLRGRRVVPDQRRKIRPGRQLHHLRGQVRRDR